MVRVDAPVLLLFVLSACTPPEAEVDPCTLETAPAACVAPTLDPSHYVTQSLAYFDTMDYDAVDPVQPQYSELVARWEWPPWLLLTGYTREKLEAADTLLTLYPSVVPERDCRFFDTNPFGRCRVVFEYDAHDGKPCPIYEEFTFNEAGEITFIEAWSDLPGMLPAPTDDPWAEGETTRLATRIPGLGTPSGAHVPLDSEAMLAASAADPDVEAFRVRADDWLDMWLADLDAAGDDYWDRGCGWAE